MAAIAADPLIAEARRRARRRRTLYVVGAAAVSGAALFAFRGTQPSQGTPPPSARAAFAQAAATAPVVDAGRFGPEGGWAINGLGLWATADGGAHWWTATPLVPGGDVYARVQSVDFVDARHGWASGVDLIGSVFYANGSNRFAAIERTTDGGRTWHMSAHDCGACGGSLSFVDARHGFALAPDGVYRTVDGGVHWTHLAAPPTIGTVSFVDLRHGFVLGWGGAVYRSADGGRSWSRARVGAKVAQLEAFRGGGVVGAGRGLVAVSGDGGRTWTRRAMPAGGHVLGGFSASSPRELVTWTRGAFWSSSDAGRSWHAVRPTVEPRAAFSLHFSSARDGWAIFALAQGPVLARTSDGGRDWTPLSPPVPKQRHVAPKAACGSVCRRP